MRHDKSRDARFVHYPVGAGELPRKLPEGLVVDTCDGVAYIDIVCLTEAGIVQWPVGVPLWLLRWISLSHHAVNIRTYVRSKHGGPPGIFFFSLEP